MAEVMRPYQVRIQHDWNEAIIFGDKQFWLSIGRKNEKAEYLKAEVNSDFVGKIRCTDPTVEAELMTQDHMIVRKSERNILCHFQAPCAKFDQIHAKNILSLDINSTGTLGISSSVKSDLVLWKTENGEKMREFTGHLADVYKCRFFPSGTVALSAGADMMLKIWNVETGECCRTFLGHKAAITDIGFIGEGKNIVSCSKDGSMKKWNCADGKVVDSSTPNSENSANACVIFDKKQNFIVGYNDGSIEMLSDCLSQVSKLSLSAPITCMTKLADEMCVCGLNNGELVVLDLRQFNTPVITIDDDRGSALSIKPYKDSFFCSYADGSVVSYPLDTKQDSYELTGSNLDPVNDIAMGQRSTNLFSCCRDGKIRKYQLM